MNLVLVVDDNEAMREGVSAVVTRMGYRTLLASSGAQGLQLFRSEKPDFIITDLRMENVDGLDILKVVREEMPDTLVMLMTAYGTVDVAVEAMKIGAFDFVTKPFKPELLRAKVQNAAEVIGLRKNQKRLQEENLSLRMELGEQFPAAEQHMVGESPVFRRTLDNVLKVSRTDSSVLISGESGTGKEMVASMVHLNSQRKDGPFVRVNCGALSRDLLESELFGHEKGSFTGAFRKKLGKFELADGGSIFLDEVGDIPLDLQVKLLRVLQEKEFDRVGGTETVSVNVRVISATNRDLMSMVNDGAFREDLYYRLHVVPLHLPPLRERRSDIPLLIDHFLKKLASRTRTMVKSFAKETIRVLECYEWPGNVRELENVVEQVLVFAEREQVGVEDLPAWLREKVDLGTCDINQRQGRGYGHGPGLQLPLGGQALPVLLDQLEKDLIVQAFQKAGGVKAEIARLLGIKTSALYYKLEKYGLLEGESDGADGANGGNENLSD